MKSKLIQPTQVERKMRQDDFIVSKTDARGIITYCNPIFIEFAGYTEQELLGKQHNIVRHPHMPRAAFKLAWDTIKSGREFFAYVKNMSKDGSYYWVFAHITPDLDPVGQLIGYTSVRRCPDQRVLDVITPLYQKMLNAEQSVATTDAVAAGTRVLVDYLAHKGKPYEEWVLTV
ncbi:PAS domain-containing protein [Marinospirillum alkaliphilum]|uniref:PAS domain S-box-containing protein n=1 Tax=Marinospirillum alkaliphilum DSM 21637 TaxID=1122209 RepID=A0A1K1X0W7_9GAMM|nr:PAS domain-containing protein [Marinospirillum alkaliphilum]SFX43290.1 PAS domain S-box-containing protein [Marinospirillum alkaliphilum DSM 21637]